MPRPRISTNFAISADGKISSVCGIASGWTSREDHVRLLELRKNAGALLVGRGTWDADRMTLTVPGQGVQPLRCIVSHSGKPDPSHPIFKTPGGDIHWLVTGDAPWEMTDELVSKITLHRLSLAQFIGFLATELQIETLHCEGGGQLIRALAVLDVIDDFHLTLAGHTLFGGQQAATTTGIPADFLPASAAYGLSQFDPRPDLGECFLSYSRLPKP